MFSGIVAAVGRITQLTPREAGFRLHVEAGRLNIDDVALGDSIAHNGVCLTVVGKDGNNFMVDVSPETLSCTVGLAEPGPVNLEKALKLSDVIGGHLVSGHVDGVGEVLRFDPVGDNRLLEIRASAGQVHRAGARHGQQQPDHQRRRRQRLHHQPDPAHAGKHHAAIPAARCPGQSRSRPDRPLC
jgi:riboflavin synthase alpha subunit